MKLFGRRKRVSQTISTQTLPIFGSVTNTSDETISPFSSISDGQMQRNTDDRFIRGALTQDKGVGVNIDNIGVLYTPAASVSTYVDPRPESPRDSMFEIGTSFRKDEGTSMTDFLPRSRNEFNSVSTSTRNSLPRERDREPSNYIPKKNVSTSTSKSLTNSLSSARDFSFSSPTERILMPRDVEPFRRHTETSFSFPENRSLSPLKETETFVSFPRNSSLSTRKDAETSFPFPQNRLLPPRNDAETSVSFPRESALTPRKEAETSFSFPRNSSLAPWDNSMPPRKDTETSLSFPHIRSLSHRNDAQTSASFPRESALTPRKEAETSLSFPRDSLLSPVQDKSTFLSQTIIPTSAQNDAYNSSAQIGREFLSPPQSLETQGIIDQDVNAQAQGSWSSSQTRRSYVQTQTENNTSNDSFGQWTHVDPNELAARMALMAWLSQPPTVISPPNSNKSCSATQTEIEVKLPDIPALPHNKELCVVGKKIKPLTKSSQRSRVTAIDPKSYPRQLKPKKTTSPYALAMNSDRMRHSKTLRRCMQFEAIYPKNHVVQIQNPWGPVRDYTCDCQVVIRPADCDSNSISVFAPNSNEKPSMNFTTTYGSDYKGNI